MDSVWPARSWIPAPRRTSLSSCWCRRCSRLERGYSTAGGKNGLRHQWGVEQSPSKQIGRQHRHPREAALWRRQQKPEDPPQLSKIWPFFYNNRLCLDTQLTTCLYEAFWNCPKWGLNFLCCSQSIYITQLDVKCVQNRTLNFRLISLFDFASLKIGFFSQNKSTCALKNKLKFPYRS